MSGECNNCGEHVVECDCCRIALSGLENRNQHFCDLDMLEKLNSILEIINDGLEFIEKDEEDLDRDFEIGWNDGYRYAMIRCKLMIKAAKESEQMKEKCNTKKETPDFTVEEIKKLDKNSLHEEYKRKLSKMLFAFSLDLFKNFIDRHDLSINISDIKTFSRDWVMANVKKEPAEGWNE